MLKQVVTESCVKLKERSAMRIALGIEGILLLLVLLTTVAQCIENSTEKAKILASEGIETVQVGDINMAYKVMGQGEPLVMIIGSGATMDWWSPEFLENLSSKYQVIVFDNRGMGYTTASPANFSIAQFANDTAGLMDALGIKQANVLGYSLGSCVGQELAIEHPERVRRLILVAGTSQMIRANPEAARKIPDSLKSHNAGSKSIHPENLSALDMIDFLIPRKWFINHPDRYNKLSMVKMTSSPENMQRQAMATYQWPGTYDRLYRIRVPTLIISGMEDVAISPENSLILANMINGSCLIRLDNAGHGLLWQYPDKVARIIADFIELSSTDPFTQPIDSSLPETSSAILK